MMSDTCFKIIQLGGGEKITGKIRHPLIIVKAW